MIDYDGKRFRKVLESGTGGPAEPGDAPVAVYHQDGDLVWAEFRGGDVRRGSLAGTRDEAGTLVLSYSMVLSTGEVISGRSTNVPEVLDDGRLRLHETWVRHEPHAASGLSCIEEVR